MRFEEMTIQEKRRLNKQKCLLCGNKFYINDDIEFVKVKDPRNGKRIHYVAFHSRCLIANQLERGYIVSEEKG